MFRPTGNLREPLPVVISVVISSHFTPFLWNFCCIFPLGILVPVVMSTVPHVTMSEITTVWRVTMASNWQLSISVWRIRRVLKGSTDLLVAATVKNVTPPASHVMTTALVPVPLVIKTGGCIVQYSRSLSKLHTSLTTQSKWIFWWKTLLSRGSGIFSRLGDRLTP